MGSPITASPNTGIPFSPPRPRPQTVPDFGDWESDSDDEEMLMLKLKQSEAEHARIQAEQEALKAKLALRELKRRKSLRQQQQQQHERQGPSPANTEARRVSMSALTTPTKQSSSAFMPDLISSDQSSPDCVPPTPTDVVVGRSSPQSSRAHKLFSPEQQKVHNDEIIKRRRLDCSPSIKNSLLPAVLRAPPPPDTHAHAAKTKSAPKPQVLVPKSPSPIKPKRHDVVPLRQMLGVDKGLSAHDISLTRHKKPKLSDTVPKSSVVVGHTELGRSGMHVAPTMGLKSTQMAQVERTRQDAIEKRRGTAYARIAKPVDTAVHTGMPFGERLMAARRRNLNKGDNAAEKLTALLQNEDAGARNAEKNGRPVEVRNPMWKRATSVDLSDPTARVLDDSDDDDDDLEIEPPTRSSDLSSVTTSAVTATPPTMPPGTTTSEPSVNTLASKLSGTQTDLDDSYTKLALLTRYISVPDMAVSMRDKMIFTVSSLYAAVAPPEYSPPAYPDWAVFGVVARKSSIMYTKRQATLKKKKEEDECVVEDAGKHAKDWKKIIASATVESDAYTARRSKRKEEQKKKTDVDEEENMQARRYFILKLTDLKQDVDVFIMGPPLDKFWKLRLGDIIAVVNPGVWPAKSGGTGFNLNITERDDEVIEVGRARDFGMCKAMTRKETPCRNWVDLRKTEYCEFHVELAVRRTSNRRAEVNKGTTMFSPKKNGQRMIMTRGGGGAREGLLPDPLAPKPDRVNRSGAKIYCLERFQDDDMNYEPLGRPKFRGH
ncbi:uncharacterized protein V1513DRAFT_450216 [Lipomyces chichibuensis]|uniref:uncharacterized protein n=1 Tax=Lipomyces chichibuensis TaxID=1546026 RepID=UPI0033432493